MELESLKSDYDTQYMMNVVGNSCEVYLYFQHLAIDERIEATPQEVKMLEEWERLFEEMVKKLAEDETMEKEEEDNAKEKSTKYDKEGEGGEEANGQEVDEDEEDANNDDDDDDSAKYITYKMVPKSRDDQMMMLSLKLTQKLVWKRESK